MEPRQIWIFIKGYLSEPHNYISEKRGIATRVLFGIIIQE